VDVIAKSSAREAESEQRGRKARPEAGGGGGPADDKDDDEAAVARLLVDFERVTQRGETLELSPAATHRAALRKRQQQRQQQQQQQRQQQQQHAGGARGARGGAGWRPLLTEGYFMTDKDALAELLCAGSARRAEESEDDDAMQADDSTQADAAEQHSSGSGGGGILGDEMQVLSWLSKALALLPPAELELASADDELPDPVREGDGMYI